MAGPIRSRIGLGAVLHHRDTAPTRDFERWIQIDAGAKQVREHQRPRARTDTSLKRAIVPGRCPRVDIERHGAQSVLPRDTRHIRHG